MRQLAWRTLSVVLSVLFVLSLNGCGRPSEVTTPSELLDSLTEAGSWKVEASWVWGEGTAIPTRMTGYGEWEQAATVRRWVNEWNGVRTLTIITPDQVWTEAGETYGRDSIDGRYRVEHDLFAGADPLVMADRYGIVLRGTGTRLTGHADCTTDGDPCTARLAVGLDRDGSPESVHLVLQRSAWRDRIYFRFSDVGR